MAELFIRLYLPCVDVPTRGARIIKTAHSVLTTATDLSRLKVWEEASAVKLCLCVDFCVSSTVNRAWAAAGGRDDPPKLF